MRKLLAALAALAVFLTSPVQAWNNTGHMLVAYIAYQNLTAPARARVALLLKKNPKYKAWVKGVKPDQKGLAAFLQAATWPDCIKHATSCPGYTADGSDHGETPPSGPEASRNIGYADKSMHKYWHYVDLPYPTAGVAGQPPQVPNAQTEIQLLTNAIASAQTPATVKSYDLVWLEHLIGDVHQPLHCTSRFTKNHPAGDNGGNLVKFCDPPCREELHAYWDDLLGGAASVKGIGALGQDLLAAGKPAGAGETDVSVWTQAGLDLAKTAVYVAPISDDNDPAQPISPKPDTAYQAAAKQIARSQVRLAGYRLAALLNANLK